MFGFPIVVLGAVAGGVRLWLGVHGMTAALVLGVSGLVVVFGIVLVGLGVACSFILLQARMRQRSERRAQRQAEKRAQRADAKRAKQTSQAASGQPPAGQSEAVTVAVPAVTPAVQTQAASPQSSDRPPLIF